MQRFRLTITIAAAPSAVFAALTAFERQPTWQRGVLSSRQEPAGVPRVGTKVHKVRTTPLGRSAFTDELTALDPDTLTYSERVMTGMIRGSGSRWQVEPAGSGARVTVDATIQAVGPWRLLERFIARTAHTAMQTDLAGLKAMVESQQTSG